MTVENEEEVENLPVVLEDGNYNTETSNPRDEIMEGLVQAVPEGNTKLMFKAFKSLIPELLGLC
jgi:hypothetical protein